MESYYQGIGRAWRDGRRSVYRVFYSLADLSIHRHFMAKNKLDPDILKYKLEMIRQMEVFLQYQEKYWRTELLHHFQSRRSEAQLELNVQYC